MIEDYTNLHVTGQHPVAADDLTDDAVIGNHPIFYQAITGATGPSMFQSPGLLSTPENSTFEVLWIGSRIRASDPDPNTKDGSNYTMGSDTGALITVDPGLRKLNASQSNYDYSPVDSQTGQPSQQTFVQGRVDLVAPLPTLGQKTPFYLRFSPVTFYAVKTIDNQGQTIGLGYVPYDVFGRPQGFGYHYEFVQGEQTVTAITPAGFGGIDFFREVNNVRTVIGSYRLIADGNTATTDGPILASQQQTYLFDWDNDQIGTT